MANYIALTSWQIAAYGTNTGQNQWLGAACRIVMDADDSTPTSYHLYGEYSFYQHYRVNGGGTNNIYKYLDGVDVSMFNTSTPREAINLDVSASYPTLRGSVRRVELGVYTSGQSVTTPNFQTGWNGTTWVTAITASYTVPSAPADPASITNTRNSDTSNTATWTGTVSSRWRLQRIEDGTMTGEWTFPSVLTYTDTLTSAGHSYVYRVRNETVPPAGESFMLASDWKTSSATYNSPAAPTAIGGARIAASTVRVTLSNTASTSTGLEVQASTDPADWSGAISQTYVGAGLQTADITGISGTYYFRARNTRGALVSDWSPISDPVVTLTAPNPPTLTSPANGSIHNYTASQSLVLSFVHNPVDGSAQTAAEVDYSTDGGSTWTTVSLTTQTSTTLTLTASSLGKTYTWRARTKGADPSWSDYSDTRTVTVYQQPTVTIALEDGNGVDVTNGTLSDMPLSYTATVTGTGAGTLSSGTIAIGNYTEAGTVSSNTLTGSITPAEAQPTNGVMYTFTATVLMSTGLTGTGSVTVTTAFADPQAGTLTIDETDGIVTLTAGLAAAEPGEAAADSISIYRDGVLLASGLSNGDTITDVYAPLNKAFEYRVVTYSAAGAYRSVSYPYTLASQKWVAIWANGAKRAEAIWNPAGQISVTRPQKTRINYIGRAYPVSYDGTAINDTRSTSWLLLTLDERDAFLDLMADGGRGVYKSADGDVYRADFDLRFSPTYTTEASYGTATITITRIDGGAL